MSKAINIGLIGFGTVGAGTVEVLQDHEKEITSRLGAALKLKSIFSRNIHAKQTHWIKQKVHLTTKLDEVLEDPQIDIIVELMGGREPAKQIILKAFQNQKSVVTANKLLLAECGIELFKAARVNKVLLGIEAAVAGSIPILRIIQDGFAGEQIKSVYGILNGTTNYILSKLERTGAPFPQVLKEAQQQGYAESDPTLDIMGFDARDKLSILAMICFGERVNYKKISVEGISEITPIDFQYARSLGCTIKLLALGERLNKKLALSVQPVLLPLTNILAKVDGAFNAIMVRGAKSGDSMYYGKGAGGTPTGIAVVSDIIAVARQILLRNTDLASDVSYPPFKSSPPASKKDFRAPYFLRFVVRDKPGIVARLASILAKYGINIDAVLQEPFNEKDDLPFVITVDKVSEDKIHNAAREMRRLKFLKRPPLILRILEIKST